MKKILFAIVAVAAMSACTKSEVEYTDQVEIGFAPVAHNVTKSVAGLPSGTGYDKTFPTTQDLFIYANSAEQDPSTGLLVPNSWPNVYFKKAQFEHRDGNIYDGTPAQYWPNVKSLIFAGYSEACNSADLTPVMDFSLNKLTIEGYIQDNTSGYTMEVDSEGNQTITVKPGGNDLMWFPWDEASYTKRSEAIGVTLKHACSWITVKVIGDNTTGNNYKLNNLTINKLYHQGNVDCMEDKAVWDIDGEQQNEVLYDNTVGEIFPGTGDAQVFENVENNFVVIPQVPTTIDVTYSYYAQAGADLITETVKNLPLAIDTDSTKNVWESGKHYVYTITITATEILVAPTVFGWEDKVIPSIPAVPVN